MENLEGLLELVDKEFGTMVHNGKFRNFDEIELAYKLIDIAKDIFCVWSYEEKMDSGYSENGYSMTDYPHTRSYPSNRGTNLHTSYGYRRGMTYSRADAREEFMNNLRDLLGSAPDEKTRNHVQRMINEMEQ